jgi:mannose-6-phosphate isomerase
MGQEKKLPPLRFLPQRVERPWGSVEYDVADLGFIDSVASGGWLGGNTLSELMETYLDRIVGDRAFDYFGTQFPVMVKTLDVKGRTSLHVNPDDETAAQRYDAFGKTALWHVLEASEDAELFIGFNRDMDASAFYTRCRSGQVEPVLNRLRPRKGDTFLVRPGTVFAAGAGLKLLEISESSELMFHLHGWGKTEEDDLEEAFDLIDFR